MQDSLKDAFIEGFLKGLIVFTIAIIVRFVYRRYKRLSNKDIFIKQFDYEKSTDLERIKTCLEYWVKVNNYSKIELVAKRLLDFDYKNRFASEEIVKAIFFNREYIQKDKMYFDTILGNFSSLPLEERPKMAIFLYLKGICEKQINNNELSKNIIEEAFDYNPELKSIYPQYFN